MQTEHNACSNRKFTSLLERTPLAHQLAYSSLDALLRRPIYAYSLQDGRRQAKACVGTCPCDRVPAPAPLPSHSAKRRRSSQTASSCCQASASAVAVMGQGVPIDAALAASRQRDAPIAPRTPRCSAMEAAWGVRSDGRQHWRRLPLCGRRRPGRRRRRPLRCVTLEPLPCCHPCSQSDGLPPALSGPTAHHLSNTGKACPFPALYVVFTLPNVCSDVAFAAARAKFSAALAAAAGPGARVGID